MRELYYRGGPSLAPGEKDVKYNKKTGKIKMTHGVSVFDRPDHPNLEKFEGAYLVGDLPGGLRVLQRGYDPSHHEIVPAVEMLFEEYEGLLNQITLIPVDSMSPGGSHGDRSGQT